MLTTTSCLVASQLAGAQKLAVGGVLMGEKGKREAYNQIRLNSGMGRAIQAKYLHKGGVMYRNRNGVDRAKSAAVDVSLECALVALAKGGDRSAYTELCRRHSKQAYIIALRITGNREDAEDVLQESLMTAFINLKGFDGRSAFSTWLTRIAIKSALMLNRKKDKRFQQSLDCQDDPCAQGHLQVADQFPNPEKRLYPAQRESQIRRAVGRLPVNLRVRIELQLLHDVSVKEIAALVG